MNEPATMALVAFAAGGLVGGLVALDIGAMDAYGWTGAAFVAIVVGAVALRALTKAVRDAVVSRP